MRPLAARLLAAVAVASLAAGLVGAGASPAAASSLPTLGRTATGYDVSWPNCPKGMGIPGRRTLGLPMPQADAQYVIAGLTNGAAFTPNPCLAGQVAWAEARELWLGAYAITTYPSAAELAAHGGTGTLAQRLHRVGRAQAAFDLQVMRVAGLHAPMVWVDVEPNSARPWSRDAAANNAVVDGVVAGLEEAGLRVGFYSYASGWRTITGDRRDPVRPTWVPAGLTSRATALDRCRTPSFSGGPVWFAQWTDDVRDFNVSCPGTTGRARTSPLLPHAGTVLERGERGPAVKALQRAVGVTPDGVFGRRTEAAVRRTQSAHVLRVTGVVRSRTWTALGAHERRTGRPSLFPRAFRST